MTDPTRIDADHGIIVTVTSGMNMIAAHRPTRFAVIMRREAANRARKARREQQLPAIPPGDCRPCAGLGVIGPDRGRCPQCGGSGER